MADLSCEGFTDVILPTEFSIEGFSEQVPPIDKSVEGFTDVILATEFSFEGFSEQVLPIDKSVEGFTSLTVIVPSNISFEGFSPSPTNVSFEGFSFTGTDKYEFVIEFSSDGKRLTVYNDSIVADPENTTFGVKAINVSNSLDGVLPFLVIFDTIRFQPAIAFNAPALGDGIYYFEFFLDPIFETNNAGEPYVVSGTILGSTFALLCHNANTIVNEALLFAHTKNYLLGYNDTVNLEFLRLNNLLIGLQSEFLILKNHLGETVDYTKVTEYLNLFNDPLLAINYAIHP